MLSLRLKWLHQAQFAGYYMAEDLGLYRVELRGPALGRKAWLFAGSDRGGQRAALPYSLIVTATLNDVDPQAWLADVLHRINDHRATRLNELLPWNWKAFPPPQLDRFRTTIDGYGVRFRAMARLRTPDLFEVELDAGRPIRFVRLDALRRFDGQ